MSKKQTEIEKTTKIFHDVLNTLSKSNYRFHSKYKKPDYDLFYDQFKKDFFLIIDETNDLNKKTDDILWVLTRYQTHFSDTIQPHFVFDIYDKNIRTDLHDKIINLLTKYLHPKMNDKIKQELVDIAPAVILQPGSKWLESPTTLNRFSHQPKDIFGRVLKNVTQSGRKLNKQEWRNICSTLDEYRKDELLEIIYDLGLREHVSTKMTKKDMCKFLTKMFKIIESAK